MRTRSKVAVVITAVLIVALVGVVIWLSVWVSGERTRAEAARREMENTYTNALYDSLDSVTEVENGLAKLLVSVSDSESVAIAADIYKDATAAAEVVGRLPVEIYKHEKLLKFLNQVGDFAGCYIRAVGAGADVSAYEDQIEEIYAATENVRQALSDAVGKIGSGDYSVLAGIEADGALTIGDGEMSIEYPSIIYDGPFSDATEKCEWQAIKGLDAVDEAAAVRLAKERLGMDGEVIGSSLGDEEVYQLQGTAGGKYAYASVTKRGGMIVAAVIGESSGTRNLGEEKAKELALGYAAKLGYSDDLQPVWYNESNAAAIVNLAPVVGGAVMYPDLIKMKVSLDDGSLLGVEACAYCTNYRERELPAVTIDEDTAISCVSPRLTVSSVRLAVIPKGNTERFCYEVAAEYKGLDYFVYVDAVTGRQVDILRVIDDNQGSLVV